MTRRIPFPDFVADLAPLDGVNYRDAFAASTEEALSAEEWMLRALAGAPRGLLAGIRLAQTALGLDLGPMTLQRPLGWKVLRSEPDIFVLGAEGPGGAARLVGIVREGQIMITTQVAFGLRARLIWALAQVPHRMIARYLLDEAVRAPGARR